MGLKAFCWWIKEEGGWRGRRGRREARATALTDQIKQKNVTALREGLQSPQNDKSGSANPAGSQRGGGHPRGHLVMFGSVLVGRTWTEGTTGI